MARRTANAVWRGGLEDGNGSMAFGSGAFEGAYSAKSRFEEGEGTNPEELIAAAHAGCFSMALSGVLGRAGHQPDSISTEATVHINPAEGGGFAINRIELRTRVRAPELDASELATHAETAKEDCPVSKALAGVGEVTVESELE